jgi:D-alanine-D-alanine ligase
MRGELPRDTGSPVTGLLRPKGHLSRTELWVLVTLASLPLFSVALRSLAFPGVLDPGFGGIQEIGNTLNQFFSLSAVPPDQREHVLYLLFLPTSALLVALARLTFGIRVLGFRSILISVGFHQSGIVPSLLLITVAVATVVLVRPWLKRIALPYYARVSVILCIVAVTMLGALLAGPWMRSDILWGTAFFPVIVLGMLAEGIAGTLDRDNIVAASWRAITTIVLAFVIALIGWVPALRSLLLQFPELVLAEIVGIVMISEYLDLRLLQGWDSKVAETLMPRLVSKSSAFRVAVVRNRLEPVVPGQVGRAARQPDALRSVQKIVDALRKGGYNVKVMEGDSTLPKQLSKFLPPHPREGKPRGIVLNLAHGIRGESRTSHVPAMLEMAGIPYIGPAPLGHAMAFDRVVARALLQEAAIPTPAFRIMTSPGGDPGGLSYPLSVSPRLEPNAKARIVRKPEELRSALKKVIRRDGQEALVEEDIAGRRISAALLGNAPVKCLALVGLDPETGVKVCPAPLDEVLAKRIRAYAKKAFRACGCRDYARIDFRVGGAGDIWVVGVGTLGILSRGGSFSLAGRQSGLRFGRLVRRIVEVARTRCHSGEPLRPVRLRSPGDATAGAPSAGSESPEAGERADRTSEVGLVP